MPPLAYRTHPLIQGLTIAQKVATQAAIQKQMEEKQKQQLLDDRQFQLMRDQKRYEHEMASKILELKSEEEIEKIKSERGVGLKTRRGIGSSSPLIGAPKPLYQSQGYIGNPRTGMTMLGNIDKSIRKPEKIQLSPEQSADKAKKLAELDFKIDKIKKYLKRNEKLYFADDVDAGEQFVREQIMKKWENQLKELINQRIDVDNNYFQQSTKPVADLTDDEIAILLEKNDIIVNPETISQFRAQNK